MPSNLRLAEILRPVVNLREHSGWQTHVRPGGFEPVGIIIHHTAGKNDLSTVINGRSDLPGPLSNLYFDRDGDFPVTLVSAGRCNHAGAGASLVLDEARDGKAAGPDAAARNLSDGPNGNFFFYGFEAENLGDGVQPWPAEQYSSMVAAAAAICRSHGWSAGHVIGHREWTRRKIDPRGFSMGAFRADVQSRITNHPLEDDVLTTEQAATLQLAFEQARDAKNYAMAALQAIQSLSGAGVDLDALAEKVANVLAQRLAD